MSNSLTYPTWRVIEKYYIEASGFIFEECVEPSYLLEKKLKDIEKNSAGIDPDSILFAFCLQSRDNEEN